MTATTPTKTLADVLQERLGTLAPGQRKTLMVGVARHANGQPVLLVNDSEQHTHTYLVIKNDVRRVEHV